MTQDRNYLYAVYLPKQKATESSTVHLPETVESRLRGGLSPKERENLSRWIMSANPDAVFSTQNAVVKRLKDTPTPVREERWVYKRHPHLDSPPIWVEKVKGILHSGGALDAEEYNSCVYHYKAGETFKTRSGAVRAAERERDERLAGLRKQIADLEALNFSRGDDEK